MAESRHENNSITPRLDINKMNLDPATWRQQVLQLGLLIGVVLGSVVYVPSVWTAYRFSQWGIVVVDTVALAVVIILYRLTRAPYRFRAITLSGVFFLLGVSLLVAVGPISQIYLFGFSLLATMFLGLRVGLCCVGLNGTVLILYGILGWAAPAMEIHGRVMDLGAWMTIMMNFVLVNVIMVVSIGAVLGALEEVVKREYLARTQLEQEQADLSRTNEALASEMAKRKTLEVQLLHGQKMEAIGQLAGGVAHDFNNLLTVINGYSELLLSMVTPDDEMWPMLMEIRDAGNRATNLTRQLLAFSRKQMLTPQIIDLNAIVANLENMLARLIGEDIQVRSVLQSNLPRIKVDPGQLEQVVLNLAVNARDAMPRGGQLTIETSAMTVDTEKTDQGIQIQPGAYVALTVSDTGCGMSEEVRSRIFEPFFTTKEMGKGTGLGLATVFGIVNQSGGLIDVSSEVGVGTRFKIFFPAIGNVQKPTSKHDTPVPKGNETLLLVEDESGVRQIARLALEAHGYHILQAANGHDAIQAFHKHRDQIGMVITDVVMPEMSGRELVEQLREHQPRVKVLYMSGYTDDAIVRHGIVEATDAFLQKPFSPLALARKVREVLDSGS